MSNQINSLSGFFSRYRASLFGERSCMEGGDGRTRGQSVEILETRIALSYTFALSGAVATVTGSSAVDSLVIDVTGGGLLEHSVVSFK
jgi:hypothetical protein